MNNPKLIMRWTIIAWVIVLGAPVARSENWAQWRGPKGDAISSERNVPVEWSPSQNIDWRTAIPGKGHSSPMVWNGSVFLTSVEDRTGERLLLRIDKGKIVWQRVVLTADVESMHRENSAASSSPVTDGQFIYTSFQNGKRVDIQCYDFAGKRIWQSQPLRFAGMHGYSYTPILYGDLAIFDFAQNDEASVIALDKRTGQVRWRWDRPTREISHITPMVVSQGGSTQVVVCGSDQIRGFNPETGESLWWCDGPTAVCVAGMTFDGKSIFAAGGYPRRTRMAVDVSGRGDVTGSHVRWRTSRAATYVPSWVYHQGYLYSVIDDGMLHCFDARTGDSVWDERIGGRFRSSLVLADGNIYATNDKGATTVFRANPARFEKVAVNDLKEFCYATPAISDGQIYIRTGQNLYCIGTAGGQ